MAGTDECLVDGVGTVAQAAMNGVLIFAFNNQEIDYFAQAQWCADRVTRHLGTPVTIVTDSKSRRHDRNKHNIIEIEPEAGGNRVYDPINHPESATWYNASRYRAYELSPYEKTLVLDSDYVTCSDRLSRIFESSVTVTAMKNVYDATGRDGFRDYQRISRTGIHHYWATVLYFDRSQLSQDFFCLMKMIHENYQHYSQIYRFLSSPFRNDFAASIALTTVYGHLENAVPEIPWSMANLHSDCALKQIDNDKFEVIFKNHTADQMRRVILDGEDFHCMNKHSLAQLYAD